MFDPSWTVGSKMFSCSPIVILHSYVTHPTFDASSPIDEFESRSLNKLFVHPPDLYCRVQSYVFPSLDLESYFQSVDGWRLINDFCRS